MYHIVNWDTGQVIASIAKLSSAKRTTRNQGHTGQHNGKYYAPVAWLRDDNGYCVYNPVFRVGKDDDFKAVPVIVGADGSPRKCSHGLMSGCEQGCN